MRHAYQRVGHAWKCDSNRVAEYPNRHQYTLLTILHTSAFNVASCTRFFNHFESGGELEGFFQTPWRLIRRVLIKNMCVWLVAVLFLFLFLAAIVAGSLFFVLDYHCSRLNNCLSSGAFVAAVVCIVMLFPCLLRWPTSICGLRTTRGRPALKSDSFYYIRERSDAECLVFAMNGIKAMKVEYMCVKAFM